MSGSAAAKGSPPTAGVGCSIPASSTALTGRASCARIGVARCWMLAIRATTGSSAAVTHTLTGRSARTMRRVTIACSSRSLSERSSCSPRWSSTAGSALRRVEPASASVPGAQAVAAHEQLGAGGDERALAAPRAEGEARREGLAQDAEHGRGVVRARRVDLDLAREDDLVQRPGADALDRPRHRGLVVLGRHRADHAVAPGRVGVEQRQRRAAQRRGALEQRARRARRRRRRGRRRRPASASPARRGAPAPPRARAATRARSRPNAASCRRRERRRSRRRPRARRPRPARRPAARASARRRARSARRRGRRARRRDPTRGQGEAVAIGVLEAEPVLARAARGDGHRGRVDRRARARP